MAAPHVAGAMALIWSALPDMKRDIRSTENLLRLTASPLPVTQSCGATPAGSVPNNTSGWGILDVQAAYSHWPLYDTFIPHLIH